jgi:hypothetical protein
MTEKAKIDDIELIKRVLRKLLRETESLKNRVKALEEKGLANESRHI